MRDGFLLADTDAHMMEPNWLWERYMEDEFQDRAPKMGKAPDSGRRTFIVEGESFTREKGPYPMAAPAFLNAAENAMERFDRVRSKKYSAEGRLEDMDEHGVDVQILFPTRVGQMLGRDFRDTKLLAASVRAYNNWAAEYTVPSPDRLRWAAALPMQDVNEAIDEARRTDELGCVGYYMRPNPVAGRTLWHRDYDPLWEVVQATGKPIATHDSASSSVPSFGDRMETHTAGHILSHPFEAMAAMAGLIWFGVLERFPELKVIQIEGDAGWVPYWLQRMEQHWQFSGNAEHEYLTMRPTEYFRRNMMVGFRGDEPTMKAAIDIVGDDNFTWDTDYPHPDGTFPWGIESMLDQPLSEESKRKLLWDNAARMFNLEQMATLS